MRYQELCLLLPCHSLEDFPTHHTGADADGLLAAWTGLWHPVLIASAEQAPNWHRADEPPADLAGRLLVIPAVSRDLLPTGLLQRAEQEGVHLILDPTDRRQLIAQALERLDDVPDVDADLVADFLALGYAYLQVELLTRQMRYASNLDEIHFRRQVLQAAQAAVAGQVETARETIAAAVDLLCQERDHYYSVEAFVLDLTLVAETTLHEPLQQQLAQSYPSNLLVTGQLLQRMRRDHPSSWSQLTEALEAGSAGLIGGQTVERSLPLYGLESLLAELQAGQTAYQELLNRACRVYGRRRYGLTPVLPQLLSRLGFEGALHATMEDGVVPQGSQTKIRWEAPDGSAVDTIARPPLDAAQSSTFLSLATKLGESMDMDHVATLCLAHWPGHISPYYHDLQRISRYGTPLGRLLTIDQYFRESDFPGHLERFDADKYRSPYLTQAVTRGQPDPISRWMRYWRRQVRLQMLAGLDLQLSVIDGQHTPGKRQLANAVDRLPEQAETDTSEEQQLDSQLDDLLRERLQQFADRLPREASAPRSGCLLVNPFSFVRRSLTEVPQGGKMPAVKKPVYAVDQQGHAVVDVPPMGFAWLQGSTESYHADSPLLAEELTVRNEFFEAAINPTTGTLQSLHPYQVRGNRISQQLALRRPVTGAQVDDQIDPYSIMVADQIQVVQASEVVGQIDCRGRLVDREGQNLCDFVQSYRVTRGSRMLRVSIELQPHVELSGDPWSSYFCCRFAWADESWDLWRTVNQVRQKGESRRLEAPLYIELDADEHRTTIFTGGLPYHRRVGHRMLDTLLIVPGETARQFQLGIGLDVSYPLQQSLEMLAPTTAIAQQAAPPAPVACGWLFHLDSKNVMATHWSLITEDGQPRGFRVRLLETNGRAASAHLRCVRSVAEARVVDFGGKSLSDCAVESDRVRVQLSANEWVEVEVVWQ